MTPAADYGSAFTGWKAFAGSDWNEFVGHRFVETLRDGSLPEESFLKYLRQDYIFLVHFSRAWALAIVKSETLDEMKSAAATVNALVNHEMRLHIETCAAAGISAEQFACDRGGDRESRLHEVCAGCWPFRRLSRSDGSPCAVHIRIRRNRMASRLREELGSLRRLDKDLRWPRISGRLQRGRRSGGRRAQPKTGFRIRPGRLAGLSYAADSVSPRDWR